MKKKLEATSLLYQNINYILDNGLVNPVTIKEGLISKKPAFGRKASSKELKNIINEIITELNNPNELTKLDDNQLKTLFFDKLALLPSEIFDRSLIKGELKNRLEGFIEIDQDIKDFVAPTDDYKKEYKKAKFCAALGCFEMNSVGVSDSLIIYDPFEKNDNNKHPNLGIYKPPASDPLSKENMHLGQIIKRLVLLYVNAIYKLLGYKENMNVFHTVAGTSYLNEVATSVIDKEVQKALVGKEKEGLDLSSFVPETQIGRFDIPGKGKTIGSFQLWAKGAITMGDRYLGTDINYNKRKGQDQKQLPPELFDALVIISYISGDADKKGDNWLVNENNGKTGIQLIDGAWSMHPFFLESIFSPEAAKQHHWKKMQNSDNNLSELGKETIIKLWASREGLAKNIKAFYMQNQLMRTSSEHADLIEKCVGNVLNSNLEKMFYSNTSNGSKTLNNAIKILDGIEQKIKKDSSNKWVIENETRKKYPNLNKKELNEKIKSEIENSKNRRANDFRTKKLQFILEEFADNKELINLIKEQMVEDIKYEMKINSIFLSKSEISKLVDEQIEFLKFNKHQENIIEGRVNYMLARLEVLYNAAVKEEKIKDLAATKLKGQFKNKWTSIDSERSTAIELINNVCECFAYAEPSIKNYLKNKLENEGIIVEFDKHTFGDFSVKAKNGFNYSKTAAILTEAVTIKELISLEEKCSNVLKTIEKVEKMENGKSVNKIISKVGEYFQGTAPFVKNYLTDKLKEIGYEIKFEAGVFKFEIKPGVNFNETCKSLKEILLNLKPECEKALQTIAESNKQQEKSR
ncbi:MAG: hypothetical protein J0H68_06105 [Sphingobacteriia bacterium]|nr:hypothetical protein [Sphingobacteriia bacterium]